jgi:hypothetical protein
MGSDDLKQTVVSLTRFCCHVLFHVERGTPGAMCIHQSILTSTAKPYILRPIDAARGTEID